MISMAFVNASTETTALSNYRYILVILHAGISDLLTAVHEYRRGCIQSLVDNLATLFTTYKHM